MISAMVQRIREVFAFLFLALVSKANGVKPLISRGGVGLPFEEAAAGEAYCLSWRLAAETNNMRGWRTVPSKCLCHVENYMIGGQYAKDVEFIMEQIMSYVSGIVLSGDGLDAWIFDVDDTCISNLHYYKGKRYG